MLHATPSMMVDTFYIKRSVVKFKPLFLIEENHTHGILLCGAAITLFGRGEGGRVGAFSKLLTLSKKCNSLTVIRLSGVGVAHIVLSDTSPGSLAPPRYSIHRIRPEGSPTGNGLA